MAGWVVVSFSDGVQTCLETAHSVGSGCHVRNRKVQSCIVLNSNRISEEAMGTTRVLRDLKYQNDKMGVTRDN